MGSPISHPFFLVSLEAHSILWLFFVLKLFYEPNSRSAKSFRLLKALKKVTEGIILNEYLAWLVSVGTKSKFAALQCSTSIQSYLYILLTFLGVPVFTGLSRGKQLLACTAIQIQKLLDHSYVWEYTQCMPGGGLDQHWFKWFIRGFFYQRSQSKGSC